MIVLGCRGAFIASQALVVIAYLLLARAIANFAGDKKIKVKRDAKFGEAPPE